MSVQIELLTRANCHLCDEAKAVITTVITRVKPDGIDVVLHEVDVDTNSELLALYSEEVPVVFINGLQHTYWKVDPERLEKCLRRSTEV